jgi:hypothetical protein
VVSGQLLASGAKASAAAKQSNSHVICDCTSKERVDKVGEKLIEFVRCESLSCKCDEATAKGRYGEGSALKTVHFRNGESTFTKLESVKPATSKSMAKAAAKKTPAVDHAFAIVVTLTGMNHCGSNSQDFQPGVSAVVSHRDPSNEVDPDNAVRVDSVSNNSNNNNMKIGCVMSMKNAKFLALWMDRGLLWID